MGTLAGSVMQLCCNPRCYSHLLLVLHLLKVQLDGCTARGFDNPAARGGPQAMLGQTVALVTCPAPGDDVGVLLHGTALEPQTQPLLRRGPLGRVA